MDDISLVKSQKRKTWDVVIIGSGPAGLTAAIYTTRGAASTIIFGGEKWGGQLMLTTDVDNFPGFPEGIQGPELMMRMRKQAEKFGAEFIEKNIDSIDFSTNPFKLTAGGKVYLANSIIIATGAETKWLGIPGEDRLRGRGISSCAPCDAPFFKNKKVVVIGGGDSAMEEALVLTKYADLVTIIHRRDEFRASKAMQQKVFEKVKEGKIKIIWNTQVIEFLGKEKLEKIKLRNNKTAEVREMVIDGAFVAIGHTPETEVFKEKIQRDKKGYIIPQNRTETNIPGVFVAGDVHDYRYKQAVTAAGFGCMAALDALFFLDNSKIKRENG